MKISWFFKNKSAINTILLCAIAATVPYKINFGNLMVIIAFVYNIMTFNRGNYSKFKSIAFIFPIFFFLIILFSSVFSKNNIEAINKLDLELLMVLIPFIIINHSVNNQSFKKVLNTFFYSCTISTFILLVNNFIKIVNGKDIEFLVFHHFTELYDQHPVYYSLYLSLAIFYKLNSIIKERRVTIINIASFVLLSIGIMFCASKAVIAIDIILLLAFIFTKIKNTKTRILSIIGFVVLSTTIININFIKDRFLEGLRFDYSLSMFEPTNDFNSKKYFDYEAKTAISDLELRYILGKIAIYHAKEDHKIYFGYGKGDVQTYLDYYNFSYNLGPNWYEGFNLHNQYLDFLITYGIFALILFLLYLTYSIYIAMKTNNLVYLFFLATICFVFLFESILNRNMGIVYFYFFNTLFLKRRTEI